MALKKRKVVGSLASRMGLSSNIDVYAKQQPQGYALEKNDFASMNRERLLEEILKTSMSHNAAMRETMDKMADILERLSLQQSKLISRPSYMPYAG